MSNRKSLTQKRKEKEEKKELEKNTKDSFKNEEQKEAFKIVEDNTISFLIGMAGTGKTYLALSYAIREFLKNNYKKIIMTRPAVEAGEKLGHLPGELENKVHPYMIPLLDMLNDKLDPRFVRQRFEE
ncbi:MAG: PhoH family protein, partial [Bacillota bacterium]